MLDYAPRTSVERIQVKPETVARRIVDYLYHQMRKTKPGSAKGIQAACRMQGAQILEAALKNPKFERDLWLQKRRERHDTTSRREGET